MAFTIDLRDICNVLPCREQRRSPSNLTKHCVGHQKWVSLSMLVTYSPTSVTWFGATGVSSDVGKYWVWHEKSRSSVMLVTSRTSIFRELLQVLCAVFCIFHFLRQGKSRWNNETQATLDGSGWCYRAISQQRSEEASKSEAIPFRGLPSTKAPVYIHWFTALPLPLSFCFFLFLPMFFSLAPYFLRFLCPSCVFCFYPLVFPTCFRFILLFGNYVDNSLLVGQIRMDAPVSTSNWKESCMDGTIWTPTIKLLTWSTHSHVTKKCEVIFKKVGRTMFKMRQNVVANLAFVSEPRAKPAQIVFA